MNRIKLLREENNIYQKDLAKLLNVSAPAINYYENEKRAIDTKTASILADYFNVSIDFLLGKSDVRKPNTKTSKIPILGIVKAGYDWLAQENIIDYVTLKENLTNIEEYFALRITGESMLPLLSNGDLVIIHKQNDVESGQTAVILINDEEATVKKVIKTNDGIELHSINPYYPTKKFTNEEIKNIPVKIIGRVREAKIKGAFE